MLRWAASSQALQVLRSVTAGQQVWATSRAAKPLHQRRDDAAATTTHWLAHQKPKKGWTRRRPMTQAQVKERFSVISSPHFERACCQLKWQTGSRVWVTSGCVKKASSSSSRRKTAMESKVRAKDVSGTQTLSSVLEGVPGTVEKTTVWEFTRGQFSRSSLPPFNT